MTAPAPSQHRPVRAPLRRRVAGLIAALLLFGSAGGVLFGPGLRPDRWVFGTDTASHDLVCVAYGWWRVAEEGRVPWWGPHLRAGQPLVASFAFMPFYPPNWLTGLAVAGALREAGPAAVEDAMAPGAFARLFADPWRGLPRVHSLQWPLHALLAALFVAAAARARGAGLAAALAAGLVFGYSGHLVTLAHAGHLAKVQAIAWLGAVAWGLEAAARRAHEGRSVVAPLGGVAAALAMMWFAGHPQIVGYGIALVVAFALAQAWRGARASAATADGPVGGAARRWRDAVGPPVAAALVILLSLALAAPVVGPALAFAPLSNRALQSVDDALVSSYPPEELWEVVLPRFLGTSLPDPATGARVYRGRWGERIVGDYIGLAAVMLALAGAILATGERRGFWGAVALAGAVAGLGGYLGAPYRWAVEHVPGFGLFRVPAAAMCLIPLGVALLAADGLDALLGRGSRPLLAPPGSGRRAPRPLVGLAAAVLAVSVAALSPLPWMLREAATGLVMTLEELAAARVALLHAGATAWLALLLGLGLLMPRVAAELRPGGRVARAARLAPLAAAALVLLLAADLVLASRPFILAAPIAEGGRELAARHAAFVALRAEAARRGHRAAAGGPPPGLLHDGREASLWPMLAGWRVPHGYHPVTVAALDAALRSLGHDADPLLDAAGVVLRIGTEGELAWRAAPPLGPDAPAEAGALAAALVPPPPPGLALGIGAAAWAGLGAVLLAAAWRRRARRGEHG